MATESYESGGGGGESKKEPREGAHDRDKFKEQHCYVLVAATVRGGQAPDTALDQKHTPCSSTQRTRPQSWRLATESEPRLTSVRAAMYDAVTLDWRASQSASHSTILR